MEKLGLWEQGITAGGEPMEGEDSLYNFSQLLFDGSMTVRWEVGGNSTKNNYNIKHHDTQMYF